MEERNTEPRVTSEHILVCLSPAPSNAKIVKTGAKMAEAFGGKLTALFVKTPAYEVIEQADKTRLQEHIQLAERLGATVEMTHGEDVSYQIAEFARLFGVTQVVLGRNTLKRRYPWGKPTLAEKLTGLLPQLDIHIIPDAEEQRKPPHHRHKPVFFFRDLAKTAGVLALATIMGLGFDRLGLSEASIISMYILAALLNAVVTTGWICNLVASCAGVILSNYFFAEPRFTFLTYDPTYPVTMLITFLAALLVGFLTAQMKNHAQEAHRQAAHSRILFETNQRLQKARSEEEIMANTAEQIAKLFHRSVVLYDDQLHTVWEETTLLQTEEERRVAAWVLENQQRAGATTEMFPQAKALYYAIYQNSTVYGVVGVVVGQEALEASELGILLSILGECALAMESKRNAKEKEQVALLAQSEKLRANLLRSISHDLRTPLTSISGNASNLISNGGGMEPEVKQEIYTDIYDDAMWLISLVENLLSVTRMEGGNLQLNMTTELMDEIVAEALRHVGRKSEAYQISVQAPEEMLLVKADSKLIVQVLLNLVDNAIKYTPPGSSIHIRYGWQGDMVQVQVADNGPGIDDGLKPYVFDMFVTGNSPIADSRRSLGLGLYLCKAIISAHGGTLTVSDNQPRGSVFTFTLKSGEVTIHE